MLQETIDTIVKLQSPELLIPIIDFIRLNLIPIVLETPNENLKDKISLLILIIENITLLLQKA